MGCRNACCCVVFPVVFCVCPPCFPCALFFSFPLVPVPSYFFFLSWPSEVPLSLSCPSPSSLCRRCVCFISPWCLFQSSVFLSQVPPRGPVRGEHLHALSPGSFGGFFGRSGVYNASLRLFEFLTKNVTFENNNVITTPMNVDCSRVNTGIVCVSSVLLLLRSIFYIFLKGPK